MDVEATTKLLGPSADSIDGLAGAWLASLTSENTRNGYRRDLRSFLGFAAEHCVAPLEATRPVIDAYARSLESAGLASSTIARRLSALASFYAYALDCGAVGASPLERVRRPKVSSDSPRLGLDRHEAAALMGAAEAAGTRDLALVSLLMLNGLRVSEAIELRIEDLTTERGHRIIRVKGKGGKQRTTPLPPPVVAAIEATISKRTGGPIILSNQGTAMDRFQASRVIRRLARRARIQKKISPHSLRHTFVTLALEAGAPIHVVQDAAGHASPETTRRYDRARFALDGHAAYTLSQHLATAS